MPIRPPAVRWALTRLERTHGAPAPPISQEPFPHILYQQVAYLVPENRRLAAFLRLADEVGLTPAAIRAAPLATVRAIAKSGGKTAASLRAARMKQSAALIERRWAGDLANALTLPLREARRALAAFPMIGEPGADRILAATGAHPVLGLDSNGLRVAVRLGWAKEQSSYAATYRAVQAAVTPELPERAGPLWKAAALLRRHGETICRRTKPDCSGCPLATRCPYPRSRPPGPGVAKRRIGLGARIALAGLALMAPVGHAQRPLNLDFAERSVGDPDRPWGWSLGWSSFVAGPTTQFTLDTAVRHRGRQTLRIVAADTAPDAPPRAITIQVPAGFAKGHELRLRGWIRTGPLTGRAILQLEEWRDRAVGAADSAVVVGSGGGSSEWSRHELAIRIPAGSDAHSVYLAAAVQGRGTAWFGPLSLELDGKPIAAIPSGVPPLTAAERSALLRRATPLITAEPLGGDAGASPDLDWVTAIVGTARVVGLGESTHGTREFFLVKHRLLEHLVTRLGFRAFAVEANQLAVERINRYVNGGLGPAAEVMRAMFAVWQTEEMRGLVEWIRGYNAAHPAAPVRFVGYDMQDHQLPVDTLRAFLQRADPSLVGRLDTLTGEYRAERFWSTPHRSDSTRARWHRQAVTLTEEVAARREGWLRRATNAADSTAVHWAVQSAYLIRQAAMVNATQHSPDRDSLMAANLDWALRTLLPGQRAVVWAHDVHVSHGGDRALSFNGGAQLGAHLKHTYRHDYRAFSLLTYRGEYTATRTFSDHRMIAAKGTEGPPGSMEAELHELPRAAGTVGWVVDVRSDRADPRDRWLWTPRPIRHIGYAAYDYGFELNAVFPIDFDGIVFIDQSSPSRRLP